MSGGDFFSSWSRRKREIARAERPPDPAEAPQAAPEPAASAEPELAPEQLEQLPSLDALTPETDLSAFLQKGVPQALRNAAFRRMWSLDPAIRDYVGDARDYDWDWNTPGGVPGFGPLASTDDIYATLDQMFSPSPNARAEADDAGGPAPQPSPAARQDEAAPREEAPVADMPPNAAAASQESSEAAVDDPAPEAPAGGETTPPALPPAQPVAAAAMPEPQPAPAPMRVRRHGGAIPH